jgi:branched-subunit amino acid ABC-type transport system permease component
MLVARRGRFENKPPLRNVGLGVRCVFLVVEFDSLVMSILVPSLIVFFTFLIMALVLAFRPQGLLSARSTKERV